MRTYIGRSDLNMTLLQLLAWFVGSSRDIKDILGVGDAVISRTDSPNPVLIKVYSTEVISLFVYNSPSMIERCLQLGILNRVAMVRLAVTNGHLETFRYLVENNRSLRLNHCLVLAARMGRGNIIEDLIPLIEDIRKLQYALFESMDHLDVIQCLLRHLGEHVKFVVQDLVEVAGRQVYLDVIICILEQGLKIDIQKILECNPPKHVIEFLTERYKNLDLSEVGLA